MEKAAAQKVTQSRIVCRALCTSNIHRLFWVTGGAFPCCLSLANWVTAGEQNTTPTDLKTPGPAGSGANRVRAPIQKGSAEWRPNRDDYEL